MVRSVLARTTPGATAGGTDSNALSKWVIERGVGRRAGPSARKLPRTRANLPETFHYTPEHSVTAMESSLIYLVFILVSAVPVVRHWRRTRRLEAEALAAAARARIRAERPVSQHPQVDVSHCIGCGACVGACPEVDVLAVVGGTAAIVNPHKCIGHGLCAEACPVGAIEIVMAPPSMSADLPVLSPEGETNIENLFVVGELSGLALIKNAVNQGRECVDVIATRLAGAGGRLARGDV